MIIVHPAAIAGAILRVAMDAGKLNGVISRDTPTGWWTEMVRLSPAGAVSTAPT